MTTDRAVPAITASAVGPATPASPAGERVAELVSPLGVLDTRLLDDWGQRLAVLLREGRRVLIAGAGGSAAQSRQLAAGFTSRFAVGGTLRSEGAVWDHPAEFGRRAAEAAIALNDEVPTTAAPDRDYMVDEVFARQVRAHGRPRDVLLAMSASGGRRSLLRAVAAARAGGMLSWCLTGPAPNPLADVCDEAVCVYPAGARALSLAATVQEAHQVALHLIGLSFDAAELGQSF